jgi:hypothetical protein
MDSLAFYVIAQGPFYKNGICHINFGNTFLSSPYVLSVGIIFCHIHNNPEMGKKYKAAQVLPVSRGPNNLRENSSCIYRADYI